MSATPPRFSVCIITFKRVEEVRKLWDSILAQDFTDYEVVCCDDCSPEPFGSAKAALAREYAPKFAGRLRFIPNPKNLGYDRNLRHAIDQATGEFVILMGDDDLLAPGALKHFDEVIRDNPDVGFVLRSYSTFIEDPAEVVQVHRYYPERTRFPPGPATVAALFHRAVLVSGLCIRRDAAWAHRTEKVDGTLYYQQYVIGMVLTTMPAVSSPNVVVRNRLIGPDKVVFGNSESEQGFWKPGTRTIQSSAYQMEQYLKVARCVAQDSGLPVYEPIRDELSRYSYAFLVYHADKGVGPFLGYAKILVRMGFGREPCFYLYVLGLLILRPRGCNWLIAQVKRRLGHTPRL